MTFDQARRDYPLFVYEGFHMQDRGSLLELSFDFCIPGLASFRPTWQIPKPASVQTDPETLKQLVFSLGMVELVSYWKITCSPTVEIHPACLSTQQEQWWKKLYYNGLGEFFYQNGIETDCDSFLTFRCVGEPLSAPVPSGTSSGCLIPVGGGKDSAVTLELLREEGRDNCCYFINERASSRLCAQTAGYAPRQILVSRRSLDPRMLELNRRGFFNGHTPFSAVVAFSAVLTAYLAGKRYVVLSNEASANDPTVSDSEVNHQYSKSFEFEQDFDAYLAKYLPCGVSYFSLLRPLSELQIAALFAQLPQYHRLFRSCNRGSKEDIWCGSCSKCLFVCLILLPFLSLDDLTRMFGSNLLEKPELLPALEELTGIRPNKPFECVGSREEIGTAIRLGMRRMEKAGTPLPLLLQEYRQRVGLSSTSDENPYRDYYNTQHLLPPSFERLVRDAAGRCWQ